MERGTARESRGGYRGVRLGSPGEDREVGSPGENEEVGSPGEDTDIWLGSQGKDGDVGRTEERIRSSRQSSVG